MTRLLITGGTGSFGSKAAKHFLDDKRISEIVIFSRDEKKQHDMRYDFNHPKVSFIVGDIRDKSAVLMATRGIDIIFHAAALKQVPTGEYFPMELVHTNIIGTNNVFDATEENKVGKIILLSTDKAVYPINAMGMSKAIAEKIMNARARQSKNTIFCGVRYGNVIASRGSVIPLFVDLIKQGKALTVTDPNMTRFLLSLDDAIDLVKVALVRGDQGDLFIRKAPAATMGDLAQALVNIFKSKCKLKIVGLRVGEKIHETLATQLELSGAEDLGNYYRIHSGASHEYDDFIKQSSTSKIGNDYTSENTQRLSVREIEKLLLSLDYIKKELKNFEK